jgi:large subunit ribosomal protein L5
MSKDPAQNKPVAPAGGKPAGKPMGTKKPGPTKKHEAHEEVPAGPRVPPRLMVAYNDKVRAAFAEKFGVKNRLAQPRLEKIVVNVNMGRHLEGTKIPPEKRQTVIDTITKITGQKPVVIKARKSVSNFKLRAGYENSAMVTMRRDRMWHFLDRLVNLATPRIKDFRGLPDKAFDRQGNYSMGLTEQGVFPEINMAEVTFTHGMHINFVFSKSNPDKSRFVLEQLGMPFRKPDQK